MISSSSSNISTDSDDDYETISVHQITRNTSIYRHHALLTVNDALDLSELEEEAEHVLSLQHILHHLATLTITSIAKLCTSCDTENN